MIYWLRYITVICAGGLFLSCDEKTFVKDSTYAEEIESFIVDSEDGKELFSPQIYSAGPFSLSDTIPKYMLVIDSSRRKIDINIASGLKDVPPYESVYDALAKVQDVYYGRLSRIDGVNRIPSHEYVSTVNRYGYFLKLYGDAYEYRGWRFWGFTGADYNGTLPLTTRQIVGESGIILKANPPTGNPPNVARNEANGYFLLVDTIPKFPPGDSLTITSGNRDVISTEKSDGELMIVECRSAGMTFRAGWKLPAVSNKFYHILTFQMPGIYKVDSSIVPFETTLVKNSDYIIPFKLDI